MGLSRQTLNLPIDWGMQPVDLVVLAFHRSTIDL